ncbi:ABC transporter ATP-binding protein [Anaerosporobacter faecicola]|uniref:ABC transporter ATP-binding protein n=1 Tax=Anaerosporobacter faecicola TaxID=2718714 RepID=UPI001438BA0F|nr:ABC transporter ATP-binding protein [Anaerosporobacter faecicola]
MNILEVEEVSKTFGNQKILDGVNFHVPEHSVFGFLGQNGAGKTTTMKIVLGLLQADHGTVRVNDQKVTYGQTKTNRYIGYLPDVPEYYGYMKPKEYLRLCGEITGVSKKEADKRIEELLHLVGLEKANKKIAGFSRGMKQRLGIAQALFNEPKLLICDEPTSALDPIGRKEILDILYQVKDKTTVVFSTHILSDVERICDTIAVLNKGKIQMQGELSQIKEKNKREGVEVEFASKDAKERFLEEMNQRQIVYKQSEENPLLVEVRGKDQEQLAKRTLHILAEKEIIPVRFFCMEPTLEDLFMEVVKG